MERKAEKKSHTKIQILAESGSNLGPSGWRAEILLTVPTTPTHRFHFSIAYLHQLREALVCVYTVATALKVELELFLIDLFFEGRSPRAGSPVSQVLVQRSGRYFVIVDHFQICNFR